MTIQTKFEPNDYAWYKYDDKWYLCCILDVHFISQAREISLETVNELYYRVYFKEITGIPPICIKGERYAYIDEKDLYKEKGE